MGSDRLPDVLTESDIVTAKFRNAKSKKDFFQPSISGNGDVELIEPDWSLYWMVNMGLTGAMASVSLLANSVLVVTVFRSGH